MLIRREDSQLLVVDIQEKLAPAIDQAEQVIANTLRLLTAAHQLHVPSFISEQYVRGLGPTLEVIRNRANCTSEAGFAVDTRFFEKSHFSCAAEPGVVDMLRTSKRQQILLCGTEAHVCVLQTALGLQESGFDVFLIADATSSRKPENRLAAIERLRACGIHIVTTEMVLFEWLHRAATDEFRSLLPLIK